MKAFFSRLHLGGGNKDKDKDIPPLVQREKFPPLKAWPPEQVQRSSSTPVSFKPLPEISLGPEPRSTPTTSVSEPETETTKRPASPKQDPDSAGRNSRKNGTTATDGQKKVAFISPSTTPTPMNIDRALQSSPAPAPVKTTLSRFQATHGKEPPRGSTSTAASSSKTDLVSTTPKPSTKAASTRTASPYLQQKPEASSQSLRSGTPYSQMSQNTSGSRILAAQSWSEVTEEDLVSNLGSRERTRQEVLFEIISSEDRYATFLRSFQCHSNYFLSRYVGELVKMKDTFIDPLLHPFAANAAALSSTPNLDYDYYRSESPSESTEHLPPIAARFMSPSPNPPDRSGLRNAFSPTPVIDGESIDTDDDDELDDQVGHGYNSKKPNSTAAKHNHPRSPYRATVTRTAVKKNGAVVPFPSRSHHSLPPPPRINQATSSTHSLGRQSSMTERERHNSHTGQASSMADRKLSSPPQQRPGVLRKFKKSEAGKVFGDSVAPHQLPEDLRICLEVIDSGVLDGHKRLSEALRKRYDDQFPLVRSLADVFVSNVSASLVPMRSR